MRTSRCLSYGVTTGDSCASCDCNRLATTGNHLAASLSQWFHSSRLANSSHGAARWMIQLGADESENGLPKIFPKANAARLRFISWAHSRNTFGGLGSL